MWQCSLWSVLRSQFSGAKRKLLWMGSKKSRVRERWIDEASTSVLSVGTNSKVLEETI